MTVLTSRLIVELIDRVSGPASAAGRALSNLIHRSNQPGGLGMAGLSRQMETLQQRARDLGQQSRAAVASVSVPAAAGVVSAFRAAVEFSRELNKATAIGELTEDQRRDVARTARDIGASTQFTAAQALAMERALIAAGRTVEQARGMARPVLNAALFGDTDPFTAARGVVAITSAYRMQMRTVEEAQAAARRVGDVVAKAANESQADFRDILQGFKMAAPIAHSAGWSMEQLAAAIAHMTNNGLRGDEAGTALRSMLVRMVKPTADARQAMAELGLSFDQFFGRMQEFSLGNFSSGMAQAGHRLSEAQKRRIQDAVNRNAARPEDQRQDIAQVLTDATISALQIPQTQVRDRAKIARVVQRYAASLAQSVDPDALFKALEEAGATPGQMARIFDSRQGSRLMTLLGPGFQAILDKIRRESDGASERGAAQMERGLYGAVKRIQSALEALVLSISESGVAERIADMMDRIAAAFRSLAETDPGTLRAIGYAMLGLAAAVPVGIALVGFAAVLKTVAAAGALAAAALSPVGAVIATVVAALAGLAVYAARNWDGLTAFASGFASTITERFPAIGRAVDWVSAKLGELTNWFSELVGKSSASTDQWRGWGVAAATAVANVIEAVMAFPQRMASALGEGAVSLYNAGAQLMQSLFDGVKAKLDEMMDYVRSIPSRIASVFSSIRLPQVSVFGGEAPPPVALPSQADTPAAREAGRTVGEAVPAGVRAAEPQARESGQRLGAVVPEGVRSSEGQAREAGASIGRLIAQAAQLGARASAAATGSPAPLNPPGRANGGSVSAGSPYMVGERGRELFVPNQNGTIFANRGSSSGPPAGRGGPVNVSAPVSVTIQGGGDANAIRRAVDQALGDFEQKLAQTMRGAFADYGVA